MMKTLRRIQTLVLVYLTKIEDIFKPLLNWCEYGKS